MQTSLPYNPEKLPRELAPFYIPASDQDLQSMLKEIGLQSIKELYQHIPPSILFGERFQVAPHLSYYDLAEHMVELSQKNHIRTSFIGDGLKQYKVPDIVQHVCQVRGLVTAYTPYQPERSQGTLTSLWIYSSLVSMLTGFEAINASLYDRSTCLFEALNCAVRASSKKGGNKVLVLESIYPGDLEVLKTHREGTELEIVVVPMDAKVGLTRLEEVKQFIDHHQEHLVAVAFPQVNSLGNLEDVDALTDLCRERGLYSIAIIDPMLLATGGLKPPAQFGNGEDPQGADILVGEGQHLAIGPNFGGPGLGIFGIRNRPHEKNTALLRATPGRFIGQAKDAKGRDARALILSTREQHIRREKATSNICSNQSFVCTLAGAAILNRGDEGMKLAQQTGRKHALKMAQELVQFKGVKLAFPETPFYNEFVLALPHDADRVIEKARRADLHVGVNVSARVPNYPHHHNNLLLLSFFDIQTDDDLKKLKDFFAAEFGYAESKTPVESFTKAITVPARFLRKTSEVVGIPHYSTAELKSYYEKLGEQNLSPDDQIYPLGSCTMKYNPYINEFAAGLPGWTFAHPQAPLEDSQGCLHILYEIQEMFKKITGLPAVTTQPCAGAQGELVGIKLFQAYHADRGESEQRKIVLIPTSAHGTNPATATMSGLVTKEVDGVQYGIVDIRANREGLMDMDHLRELVQLHGRRILGVMVTNPNTSGLFETQFKEMAELVHAVGGLVYMDGANMNAIAGWVDLGKMGVDAVHNNLHKTWTIPHGGGGPGDGMVAVSERLIPYLPGHIVEKNPTGHGGHGVHAGEYYLRKAPKSIGSFHRHYGNFAHKVRCYTYLKALGTEGIMKMSSVAVLASRYLFKKLKETYPTLPEHAQLVPRMHEFIITLDQATFKQVESVGIPKGQVITRIGKLFLDFGMHTPTVAFPEAYGLMIEPTESYTKSELDRFIDVVKAILHLIHEAPQVLTTAPHFTPVDRIDELSANKTPVLWEKLTTLPEVLPNRVAPSKLTKMGISDICQEIIKTHQRKI